jgi:predicted hydrocarbon binding protein
VAGPEAELARRLAQDLEQLRPATAPAPSPAPNRDLASGIWRRDGGERAVLLTPGLLFGLRSGLGERAAEMLYRAGRAWGEETALRLEAECRRRCAHTAWDTPSDTVVQLLDELLAGEGWGRLRLDFGRRDAGLVEALLEHSALSESQGEIGRPGCQLYAGMLAGLLGSFARRDLEACEIACRSAGAERCWFVIARGPVLQPVPGWVEAGVQPQLILEQLSAR